MKINEYLINTLSHPDNSRRTVQIIHHYFPKTEPDISAYLDYAEKNGIGGFCVNMDVPASNIAGESQEDYTRRTLDAYLGEGTSETDEAWLSLKKFIDACFRRGFKLWIYDEKAYPSGAAGDKVLRSNPDYQVKGLICFTYETSELRGSFEGDTGKLRYAAAYKTDGSGVLKTDTVYPVTEANGRLNWDLSKYDNLTTINDGEKLRICAFYTRAIEFYTENKVPYVDLMRADVTDKFIETTHEAYRRHLGDEAISKITAFFTDEPGLPTHGCSSYFYEKNAIAAWTEEMDTLLPADMPQHYVDLFFDTDRNFADYRRIYWQIAAKLYSENYFKRIADWCGKYHTRMTGHLYGEETLSMQVGLNADLFGLMRYMQAPGVDRLYCTNPRDVTAEKTASSAAHLYGRDMTMSENSFHLEYNFWKIPDEATPEARQNSAYYQIQLGITNIASYFPYSPQNDPERRKFDERCARAAMFCDIGCHQTDVLVLIPMSGAYERFAPQNHKYWDVGPCTVAPHQPKSIQVLEQAYGGVLAQLEDSRLDFDLIDECGFINDCIVSASDGKIYTKYENFKNLVIFSSGVLQADTMEKITDYLNHGGHITIIDTDIPSKFCRETAEKYPDLVITCDYGDAVSAVISGGASPVLNIIESVPTVRVRKSCTDSAELWFIHNRGNTAEKITINISPNESFTVYNMDMIQLNLCKADSKLSLTIPANDAVMLVK